MTETNPKIYSEVGSTDLQVFAEHQVSRYSAMSGVGSEQLIKTSGWLTGAIFALNGAGALATINLAEKLRAPLIPAIAFVAGLALILLNGVAVQSLISLLANPIENAIMFWKDVAIRGEYVASEDARVARAIARINRFSWIAPVFGWAAAVAFFTGGLLLVSNVPHR